MSETFFAHDNKHELPTWLFRMAKRLRKGEPTRNVHHAIESTGSLLHDEVLSMIQTGQQTL